jgi:DNA-binding HxlR family transcriptional regulator
MDTKDIDEARDKKLDELELLTLELDDICHEIWFTLMAYKRLRFNDLHRYLKKFGTDISKPALIDHLNHLKKLKVITRKHEKQQGISYGLTDEINQLMGVNPEDIATWLERFEHNENLPDALRTIKFDEGEFLESMTEQELDQETDKALRDTLAMSLFEFKNFIDYDVKIDSNESNAVFWKFVGNPMYRMHEKSVAEDCRASEKYKKSLFEKIDLLIEELRSDKELLRERRFKAAEKVKKTKSEVP